MVVREQGTSKGGREGVGHGEASRRRPYHEIALASEGKKRRAAVRSDGRRRTAEKKGRRDKLRIQQSARSEVRRVRRKKTL